VPLFVHPPRVPIGHEQQMDQYKLDELVGRPFDTAMALARMILSGLFDRYPRLKVCVAHMGGGLLPVMGRLDFGWRLGSAGHARARHDPLPGAADRISREAFRRHHGFWAPHVRQAVEVFGAERVMFGTTTAGADRSQGARGIVNGLGIPAAQREDSLAQRGPRFSISG